MNPTQQPDPPSAARIQPYAAAAAAVLAARDAAVRQLIVARQQIANPQALREVEAALAILRFGTP